MAWDKCLTRNEKGFSLVELMIVVGIIGLLATLAVPRFQQFQAKARMAEAKNMLSHLYTLEEAYHLDNNQYQNMGQYGRNTNAANANCNRGTEQTALGFEISPCNNVTPRFGYEVTGANAVEFRARAFTGTGQFNVVCPNNNVAIEYVIDQTKTMTSPNRAVPFAACP